MRTIETTYRAPNRGVGASENLVPEGLKKLGRLAVWAVAGGQFIDLIWSDCDGAVGNGGPSVSPRGDRLSQAELADLIRRATRADTAGTPSCR